MLIIAAGGVQSASGADIAAGMQRLVTGTETYGVGPEDVKDVVQALTENHGRRLALQGTWGAPDFDVATGTRQTRTSIYCMSPRDQDGTSWDYEPDILRYDPESDTLVGEQTCIAGFSAACLLDEGRPGPRTRRNRLTGAAPELSVFEQLEGNPDRRSGRAALQQSAAWPT